MTDRTPDFQQLAHHTLTDFPGARNAAKRRERLTRLADKMARLRPTKTRHFHLRAWEEDKPCGTAACAVGYAMVDPWFNRRGLIKGEGRDFWGDPRPEPEFRGLLNVAAVKAFFCLSEDAAMALIDEDEYPARARGNPRAVAARIRAFLAALDEAQSTKRTA